MWLGCVGVVVGVRERYIEGERQKECVCSLSLSHANTFATSLTCGLISVASVASVAHVDREFC